eukprot:g16212.t1
MLTMLAGFALASQLLWPPWMHAPAAMAGIYLWLLSVVYATDATIYGALFGEVNAGYQMGYTLAGAILPYIVSGSLWQSGESVEIAKHEVFTTETKVVEAGLFPSGLGSENPTGLQLTSSRVIATLQFAIVPLLFPASGAASLFGHGMRLERLLLFLHQYRSALPGSLDFDKTTPDDRLKAATEANKMGDRGTRNFVEQKMNLVHDALFEKELYGGREKSLSSNLFFFGRLPQELAKLFDDITPTSETVEIAERKAPRKVVRTETIENRIRHKEWKSATEYLSYIHSMSFVGFFTGFVIRFFIFLFVIINRALKEKATHSKREMEEQVEQDRQEAVQSGRLSAAEREPLLEGLPSEDRDVDVVREEQRIRAEVLSSSKSGQTNSNSKFTKKVSDVSVVDVTKKFEIANAADKWALNGVTFGVNSGEVFGLLGPNGAGKSTMFTLLSGNWQYIGAPTSGDIRILNQNVTKFGFADAYRKMGIVPQFDKHLFPYASAQQHLELYMVVKNVDAEPMGKSFGQNDRLPVGRIELSCAERKKLLLEQILREVGLDPENHQPVGEYSGGMMRRLSLALSLITDPQVLFLDEVSGGVDIVSQRLLWKKMTVAKPKNQTIITASHSMSEVEAVCDRVGILSVDKKSS